MQFSTLIVFIAFISLTLANPIPGDVSPNDPPGCDPSPQNVVVTDKQIGVEGNTIVGASSCIPVSDEACQLSHSISYTVSLTVSVGVAPTTEVGGLGGVDVAWTTAKGSTDGSGSDCPVAPAGADQWTCALNIMPAVVRISGTETTIQANGIHCDIKTDQPFTLDAPIINSDGSPNIRTQLCACQDFVGWASPGAPPLCASPCKTA